MGLKFAKTFSSVATVSASLRSLHVAEPDQWKVWPSAISMPEVSMPR